jgi:hypothetical protein
MFKRPLSAAGEERVDERSNVGVSLRRQASTAVNYPNQFPSFNQMLKIVKTKLYSLISNIFVFT